MRAIIDLTGMRFTKLRVIKRGTTICRPYKSKGGKVIHNKVVMWWCKCDCGKVKEIDGNSLRRGYTKSCGCIRRETTRATGKLNKSISNDERMR